MLKSPFSSVKTTDCHFVNRGSPFLRSDQFQNKVLSDSLTPGGVPEALAFFFFFFTPLTLMANKFPVMDVPTINIEGTVNDFKHCSPGLIFQISNSPFKEGFIFKASE